MAERRDRPSLAHQLDAPRRQRSGKDVIIDAAATAATATDPANAAPPANDAAEKRDGHSAKRGPRRWVVVLSVALTLVVALGVLADYGVRSFAEGFIRDRIVETLALPPGSQPRVELGSGSLISQALTGRIDSVTVSTVAAPLGAFTGDLRMVATGVPLDLSHSLASLDLQLAIAETELQPFVALLGDLPIESMTLAASSIVITSTTSLYGTALPVVAELVPSAKDGQVILTLTAVTVGEVKLTLEAAQRWPYSLVIGPLVTPKPLCLAEYLPVAVALRSAAVVDGVLILDFSAQDVILNDNSLTTLGSCP